MPSSQSNRQGLPSAEASPLIPRHPNSSTQASLHGSGSILDAPGTPKRTLSPGSHARSPSAGDSGNTSTTFHFGQRKSSDFAPTVLDGHTSARSPLLASDASSQVQVTDSTSSSPPPVGSQGGRPVDVFLFGQHNKDAPEPKFTLGSLHNFTPLPSPRASPTVQGSAASFCNHTPSPGSSPIATASVSGPYLSPPRFSLSRGSSPSIPDITNRTRSLSLAAPPANSVDALSASPQTPSESAPKACCHSEPYDPRDEPGPAQEYFTPDFQEKLREGLSIAKRAVTALERLGTTMELDEEAEQLLKEAKELSSARSDVTRKIAILGDSGEGKSSLINSLLHFPGLAQTGDIGSACTSVVTEYRHKQERHTAPITIEVEYLSGEGIEELLRELLWSYRQLYLPLVESDKTTEQEYARFQAESDHAWSALEAAFGHQPTFKKELLRDMSDGASERALDQLLRWSREIEWPAGGEQGNWTSTATTAEECCEKTRVFMQDRLWPFTKIIRVYLSSQILKTGIILADLPGLQDTNLARVRATQDYLMQCDNVFIVAKIARAITNKSVKSSMYWALSRHAPMEWEQSAGMHLNVSLVCTRSEDINIETAKREFCGPGKRIPSDVLTRLEADINDAKRRHDRERKKELKRRLEFLLIRARNAHVKEGVQQTYSSEIPEGKMNIFCVSNTVYDKYSRKGNLEFVAESGIVELRQFCHSITAEAQLREGRHYLHSSLSSLLNSLGLWAGSRLPDRVQPVAIPIDSLKRSLKGVKKKARQSTSQLRQDFTLSFDELIMSFLSARESHWDRAAQAESSSWNDWHWSNTPHYQVHGVVMNAADDLTTAQYNAWCLRNGNHYTVKRGAVDWNAKIIWKMRMELDYQWDLIMDEVAAVFKTLRESLVVSLNSLKKQILECPKTEALASLANGIDSMIGSWNYKLELMEHNFASGVGALRRRSSESHSNSYILNEMIPSYRSASGEKGTGKAARQRGIVGGKISGGTIFPNLSIRLSADMRMLVAQTEQELNQLVAGFMRRLDDDMAMALRLSDTGRDVMRTNESQAEHIKTFMRQIDTLKARRSALDAV